MSLQLPCSAVLKYLMLQGIVCFGGSDGWRRCMAGLKKDWIWACFGENAAAPCHLMQAEPVGQRMRGRAVRLEMDEKRLTNFGFRIVSPWYVW
jgi:hypothetical protein